MSEGEVHGRCEPGFEPLRDALGDVVSTGFEDMVLQRPTRFGLGFQLTMRERPLGPGPRAFGHFGAGGSLGFADPDAQVAIGYAMNQSRPGWQHPHVRHLVDLVYAAL